MWRCHVKRLAALDDDILEGKTTPRNFQAEQDLTQPVISRGAYELVKHVVEQNTQSADSKAQFRKDLSWLQYVDQKLTDLFGTIAWIEWLDEIHGVFKTNIPEPHVLCEVVHILHVFYGVIYGQGEDMRIFREHITMEQWYKLFTAKIDNAETVLLRCWQNEFTDVGDTEKKFTDLEFEFLKSVLQGIRGFLDAFKDSAEGTWKWPWRKIQKSIASKKKIPMEFAQSIEALGNDNDTSVFVGTSFSCADSFFIAQGKDRETDIEREREGGSACLRCQGGTYAFMQVSV